MTFSKINKILSSITLMLLMFTFSAISKPTIYEPSSNDYIKTLIPSQDRYVINLSGEWERSYNESKWSKVSLPECEQENQKIIYRKTINIPPDQINNYVWQLYFLGVDDEVELYFNDQFVGRYLGAMTPFTVRIQQSFIKEVNNVVKLVCYPAQYASRTIKQHRIDSKRVFTGVIRDIFLIGTPEIWVSDININLKFAPNYNNCLIRSTVKISSVEIDRIMSKLTVKDSIITRNINSTSVTVEQFLKNKANGEIVAQSTPQRIEIESERTISVDLALSLNQPALWSISNPNLYELVTRITKAGYEFDEYNTTLGLSDFTIHDRQFYLNGNQIDLKGVSYIEDFFTNHQYLTFEQMEQDISLIKTLGTNVIRFCQTIPHPYLLDLCYKYGIMVFVELPVYSIPKELISSDEVSVRMMNIADRIITAYNQYLCVIAYGSSEGIEEGTKQAKDYSSKLTKLLSSSNRLIYKIALLGAKTIDSEHFDFIGITDIAGNRDFEQLTKELNNISSKISGKPVFVSFGLPIQVNNYNGYSDPLSLEFQAYYIQKIYEILKRDQITSNFFFAFNDFETENPLLITNNKDEYDFTWGIVDRNRNQRKSYQTLKALFNIENTPLLSAGSFIEDSPLSYIILGLVLVLIVLFLLNRFRRFREYLFRSLMRPYNFYADIRDQRIISATLTTILAVVISFSLGLFISSIFYYFRSSEIAQNLIMLLIPSNNILEVLYKGIWMPEILVLLISCLIFILIFIIAFLLKIFSFLIRPKIFFSDTFIITVWSATPAILLLPFSIVLVKLMIILPAFSWLFIFSSILFIFWILSRLLRSTSVVFDVASLKAYIFGLSFIFILIIISITIYEIQSSIFAYGYYFVDVIL
jgi:hypothetical protein